MPSDLQMMMIRNAQIQRLTIAFIGGLKGGCARAGGDPACVVRLLGVGRCLTIGMSSQARGMAEIPVHVSEFAIGDVYS